MGHIPVLLKETLDVLSPKPKEFFVEGTVGGGGHTKVILDELSPGGKYLGIDLDIERLKETKKEIEEYLDVSNRKIECYWFNSNFSEIKNILKEKNLGKLDGLLLDLGFSSFQIDSSGLGFSFRRNDPLIMRYDGDTEGFTAARFLNEYSKDQIAKVIREYGEEGRAHRIASSIARYRSKKSLRTTSDLVEAIEQVVPNRGPGIHPATKTFMAVRMFINKELEHLEVILNDIKDITNKGARIAIISFHSLEDKVVKNYFKKMTNDGLAEAINKKVIKPTYEEIKNNPRSRSAKLRSIKILN